MAPPPLESRVRPAKSRHTVLASVRIVEELAQHIACARATGPAIGSRSTRPPPWRNPSLFHRPGQCACPALLMAHGATNLSRDISGRPMPRGQLTADTDPGPDLWARVPGRQMLSSPPPATGRPPAGSTYAAASCVAEHRAREPPTRSRRGRSPPGGSSMVIGASAAEWERRPAPQLQRVAWVKRSVSRPVNGDVRANADVRDQRRNPEWD